MFLPLPESISPFFGKMSIAFVAGVFIIQSSGRLHVPQKV